MEAVEAARHRRAGRDRPPGGSDVEKIVASLAPKDSLRK